MESIQAVESSLAWQIATPMNIPTMQVMAESVLYINATYHFIPLDSKMAKSPNCNKNYNIITSTSDLQPSTAIANQLLSKSV